MFPTRPRARALAPLTLSLLLGMPTLVAAQAVTIEFTNTELPPIELLDNTSVTIDGDGNLEAQCVPEGDSCKGVSTGTTGPVPAVTLGRTGTGVVNTGATLALNWGVQNTAAVCLAKSSPTVAGWNNILVAANGGTANLSMTTPGTFNLTLQCYNDFGASNLATLAVTVQGQVVDTQIPACTDTAMVSTGRVQPANFTGNLVQWKDLFYNATFPHGPSHLSPIGSFTLRAQAPSTRGPTMNARYITTPFTAGPNASYQVQWLGAQPIGVIQYNSARVAQTVFVSISPCAGDLRGPSPFGGADLKLCRAQLNSGSLKFGTTGATGQCPLVAGEKYFLNIAMVDTLQPGALSTTTTTCAPSAGNRCEANFNGN